MSQIFLLNPSASDYTFTVGFFYVFFKQQAYLQNNHSIFFIN